MATKNADGTYTLASGAIAHVAPVGKVAKVVRILTLAEMAYQDEAYADEGRFCSICDGAGHGYPGGRPCPLEDRGWEDSKRDRAAGYL